MSVSELEQREMFSKTSSKAKLSENQNLGFLSEVMSH